MNQQYRTFDEALVAYDWESAQEQVQAAAQEREDFLQTFPLEKWATMQLEEYALGHENSEDAYCRWLEFKTKNMGSILGGAARKHIIYKHKNKDGWYYYPPDKYSDVNEAWVALRAAFVDAFTKAKAGDWNDIDEIDALQWGPALRVKSLYLYFPEHILPVYSRDHLTHFLTLLGLPEGNERTYDVVRLNRVLLSKLREIPQLKSCSTKEIERFLYFWADPRAESRRVVKIAPGKDAAFWEECLSGGYICVGWDSIGSLDQFEDKDEFSSAFDATFATLYATQSKRTKKANELWTLRELEPGDLIVANHGTSHVLAVGEVVEPGYEFRSERGKHQHVVNVKWDTNYACDIKPQKSWAMVTVAKVQPTLYQQILSGANGLDGNKSGPVPVESIFSHIADALERKGQAILYGPPGTGKTYTARRFAVWWLRKNMGLKNPGTVLAPGSFEDAEKELSTTQVNQRVWWVVANPKEWCWEQLFSDGQVLFQFGKLPKNFPLVQPGDLVVGYQSSPDKRLMALAQVSKGLHTGSEGAPQIELEPLVMLDDGHTYEELIADEVLKSSEPMRSNNRGTLFSLTKGEAEYLLSALVERNPIIESHIKEPSGIGALTGLTFHASYSYEDFIEGFRPVDTGKSGLTLRLEDGVFKRICREAQAHPQNAYLVLIDEFNRANVAKVLGELITLLEMDKRGFVITLPQSKEPFTIPKNVYILGTMNTADRSIKLLDAALRRRFAFIEMMPDSSLLAGVQIGNLALDDFLSMLNSRVAKEEGREKQIGHSFLFDDGQPITDSDELARRFRQEILPLLQEYCYDNYVALEKYIGGDLVDAEAQMLRQEILDDPEKLLAALETEFK